MLCVSFSANFSVTVILYPFTELHIFYNEFHYFPFFLLAGASALLTALPKRGVSAVAAVQSVISKELDGIKAAGTWKSERVITSKQASDVTVQGVNGEVINFCANNYLGLAVSHANYTHFQTIY